MTADLDPVVFEVLAMVEGALASLTEVQDSITMTAAKVAESTAAMQASLDGFTAGMAGAAVKTEEDSAKIRESTHEAGIGLKEMAEAMGVFAAFDFLKDSVKTAAAGQQAYALLGQIIRNTGVAFNEEMAKSVEEVDAKMRNLGYTNEQTNVGLARMIQMTHSAAGSEELMSLAANVAAARHMQLNAAVRLVGMAATGHIALLGRLGIATKDAAGRTLSAKGAIDMLSQTFSGSAKVAAQTAEGQFKSFSAQMDDTKEKIGAELIPVIQAMLPPLLAIVQELGTILVPILKIAADLMRKFGGALEYVIPALLAAVVAMKVAKIAQMDLNQAMKDNVIGIVVFALMLLVEWLIHCWNTSKSFRDGVQQAFRDIEQVAGAVVSTLIQALQALMDAFLHTVQAIVDGMDGAAGWLVPGLDGAKSSIDSFVSSTDATMQGWAHDASMWGQQVQGIWGAMTSGIVSAVGKVAQAQQATHKATGVIGGGIGGAGLGGAPNLSSALSGVSKHVAAVKKGHADTLASAKAHYAALAKTQEWAAKKREAQLKAELTHLQNILAVQKALQDNARHNINIVNGAFANAGTSLLNLGYAGQSSSAPITVNVAGSVVSQQQLVTAVQQGLLTQQRTNSSLGIKGIS